MEALGCFTNDKSRKISFRLNDIPCLIESFILACYVFLHKAEISFQIQSHLGTQETKTSQLSDFGAEDGVSPTSSINLVKLR